MGGVDVAIFLDLTKDFGLVNNDVFKLHKFLIYTHLIFKSDITSRKRCRVNHQISEFIENHIAVPNAI